MDPIAWAPFRVVANRVFVVPQEAGLGGEGSTGFAGGFLGHAKEEARSRKADPAHAPLPRPRAAPAADGNITPAIPTLLARVVLDAHLGSREGVALGP